MTHALLALGFALSVLSQPLAEEVPTGSDRFMHAELGVPIGGRAWAVPGPFETEWLVVYDETPLTLDDPVIDLRLINDGRPVRVPRTTGPASMVVTLTDAVGNLRRSERLTEWVYVYQSGTNEGRIDTGRPIVRASANLAMLFGELSVGTYEAVVEIDTGARLERARDGHVIEDDLKITTPRFRFEVVKVPPPVSGQDRFELNDEQFDRFGHWSATLTNTLDEPIKLWVDGMFRSNPKELVETPLFAYNGLERWTKAGWVDVQTIGYCGTGMQEISLAPGESVRVALNHHTAPRGVFRATVGVRTAEDADIEFVSAPIEISRTGVPRPIPE